MTEFSINREHAEFHLEILGPREENCIVSKNYSDSSGKDVKTYWAKANEVLQTAQELNKQKRICWISLNDKEHGIDTIEGVKALNVLYIDVDARPKGKENHSRLATTEELEAAHQTALKIKNYLENAYSSIGFLAHSGNGFHIFFPLPITPLHGIDYRNLVNEKLKAFTKNNCAKNNASVDALDYTRRVTTLIGSWNLKLPDQPVQTKWLNLLENDYEKRMQVIAHAREINGEKLLPAILQTETEKTVPNIDTAKPHPKLESILKMDLKLSDMYNGDFQKHTGNSDRSQAEMIVVCKLIGYGFTDQEIEEAMFSCRIGKWQEKPDGYHNLTIKNAHNWISDQEAKQPKGKDEVDPEDKEKNLARNIAGKFIIVKEKSTNELYIYNPEKGIYEADLYVKNTINGEICQILQEETKSSIEKEVFYWLTYSPETKSVVFDEHPALLAVNNGIVNILTKELTPFTPDIYITSKLAWDFKDGQPMPALQNFLDEVLPNKIQQKQIQQLLGHCLYKKIITETSLILLGKGENGKSILLETFKTFLGQRKRQQPHNATVML